MTFFDLILILIVFGFIWFGFWFGFLRSIGGLVGLIVGAAVASRYFDDLAPKIVFIFWNNLNVARFVSFLLIYIVVNRLVGFIFFLLEKILKPILWLPFLKTINRLGGMLVRFVEGGLTVGLILYFLTKFPIQWFTELMVNSELAPHFLNLANFLLPLLPKVLKQIQSVI